MTLPRKPQIRLRYSKLGKVRFTSHRDMARIWERAVRRAGLPIAYSEGFSPRAKLSFGLALPTVFESQAEYVDMTLDLDTEINVAHLPELLTPMLPEGVDVIEAVHLSGKVTSLQEVVETTTWSLFVAGEMNSVESWVNTLLAAETLEITRERKGKTRVDDVREALLHAEVRPIDSSDTGLPPKATCEIFTELATKPRALRPLEFLGIQDPTHEFLLGRRISQYIAPHGAQHDPLVVGAAVETSAAVCAS